MIRIKLMFWITDKEINKWTNDKNIFFILAIGRSGTKFLASLLNKASGAYVVHEPVREDFQAYLEAFYSEERAESYIRSFRKKEIYIRIRNKEINTYGEVNGVLRRHYHALKIAFPNAKFIHLVRDGRDVVRSMMSRYTMTLHDPVTSKIHPHVNDPWYRYKKWKNMDRFEKICYYWQIENKYLRERIPKRVQFEKILTDYEYFKENVLFPLNIYIPIETWKEFIKKKVNPSTKYILPYWEQWNKELIEKFNKICGEEMTKNGYII